MGDVNLPIAGGCFCGAVRYEAVGKPVYVLYCHSESCRRATGAPVVAYLMLEKEMVRFTEGKRKVFESSPGVHRTFCSICGTPLTWEGVWGGRTVIELHLGTLDRPEAFPPDRHVFYGERFDWFEVEDGLPRYSGSSTGVEPDGFGPAAVDGRG
jgi:hypothetical protein